MAESTPFSPSTRGPMTYQADDNTYYGASVVYIESTWDGETYTGSGVLVGRNDVLTASHVLYDQNRGGTPDTVRIYPSYNPDSSDNVFFTDGYFEYFPDFDPDGDGLLPPGDFNASTFAGSEYDMALISLYEPIGDTYGWFGMDLDFAGGSVGVLGFPAVYGRRLMYDGGTVTPSWVDGVYYIEDDLEVNGGNSGGPVYYDYGDGPFVIGVVSTGIAATSVGAHSYWLLDAMAENDSLLTDGINTPPDAGYDSITAAWASQIKLDVLANDRDADGDPLSVISVTQPTDGGTVWIGADGNVYLSPDSGFSGHLSFIYTISDNAGGTDQASVGVTVTAAIEEPPGGGGTGGVYNVYRFYNTETGVHFYTASETEAQNVRNTLPQFSFEGNAFDSNATSETGGAVHRFFNTSTGTHFYTISEAERKNIVDALPIFDYEGIAYYAHTEGGDSRVALHRFFNTQTGTHFYTASDAERQDVEDTLSAFHYEGIAYYVDVA